MDTSSRMTTIQITLLSDGETPQLRGRIRLAGGATLPFVGTRALVTHLRSLLTTAAQHPPQWPEANARGASVMPSSHGADSEDKETRRNT